MKKILILHNKYIEKGGEDIAVQREIELLKEKYIVKELIFDNKDTGILNTLIIFLTNSNFRVNKIIKNTINDFQPNYVYIHNTWFTISLQIFKILFKKGIPIYLKIHNFRYNCTNSHLSKNHFINIEFCEACGNKKSHIGWYNMYFESLLKSIFVNRYGKKYFKILSNPLITLLVLTNFHKEFLINQNFNEKNIKVVPNFLEVKNKSNSNEIGDTLVYAGRISKEKGVEGLITTFLQSSLKLTKLHLIGDGPELDYLKEKYSSNRVIFNGSLDNEKVLKYIASSKAVISNTLLYEGQPTLLCEATMLNRVSIFPKNGGIEEFFNDDYFFKFNSKNHENLLEKLESLSDNELLKNESRKAKKHIESILSKELILNKFEEIFVD
jgi:glycosyltransferase involved in cell wall biosynthesis